MNPPSLFPEWHSVEPDVEASLLAITKVHWHLLPERMTQILTEFLTGSRIPFCHEIGGLGIMDESLYNLWGAWLHALPASFDEPRGKASADNHEIRHRLAQVTNPVQPPS